MKLFIYGAGGAGVEVYDLVMRNSQIKNRYSAVYFIDDFQEETEYYGTMRIHFSSCEAYVGQEKAEFVIAVGEPSARRFLFEKIKSSGYVLTTLIDERAIISDTAKISEGCVINADTIVSFNVVIEKNCFIMFDTIIGHDAVIHSHSVISPKAMIGGHCFVGEQCFVGLGSSMIQRIKIGNKTIIGMGAVLFRDVGENLTVIGNPARVTKGNDGHKVFF
ncbi:MAG: acetyltransferase [Ruminococcus flavefaciens]|nr:acetyltransferase [Ruminococcus flavefaciens]